MEHSGTNSFFILFFFGGKGLYNRVDKKKKKRNEMFESSGHPGSTAGKESRHCSSFLALGFVGCKPPHDPGDSCRVVVPWPWADKLKAVCLMY